MKKRGLSGIAFAMLSCMTVWAQPAGLTPTDGGTYLIYNVATGTYMADDGTGELTLSSNGMAVTLNELSDGTYQLSTPSGTIGSDVLDFVRCDGTGTYDNWTITLVEGYTDRYNIGCYVTDNYAFSYLRWSSILKKLFKSPTLPDATLETAQWIFVDYTEQEPTIVTLQETTTDYSVPEFSGNATVHLERTLTLNSWNTFCVPFSIPAEQVKAAFGNDCKVAQYTDCDETTLYFKTVGNIEAATPYLLRPTAERTGSYYEFTDVTHFAEAPQTADFNGVKFVASFQTGEAPQGSYVLRKNEVYHLPSAMAMKAFRGYFIEESGNAKIANYVIDSEQTGIEAIETGDNTYTVFNLNGQCICNAVKNLEALPKGVYIINGKKTVIR